MIGGDYQGLGIVRSLGRRGIEVLVLDDERSISRHSRFTTAAVRVPDLRDERRPSRRCWSWDERHGLDGWVVFPTREETVAALSRHRDRLLSALPRADPLVGRRQVGVGQAQHLRGWRPSSGSRRPSTWVAGRRAGARGSTAIRPFAVKPAIKEHFLYATGQKAWRADTREQLASACGRPRDLSARAR